MATLTISQAIQSATRAGFTGSGLITIVAIAMAESGLNSTAVGHNLNGTTDYGILQINSVHFGENYGGVTVSQSSAQDPDSAFRIAYGMSQGGTNFCAWCTYNAGCASPCNSNGPYKNFISQVQQAAGHTPTQAVTPTSLQEGVTATITQTITTWGEYIAVFVIAAVLVILGLYLVAEKSGGTVLKKAGDAIVSIGL
jgi:hypothetical protein